MVTLTRDQEVEYDCYVREFHQGAPSKPRSRSGWSYWDAALLVVVLVNPVVVFWTRLV